MRQSQRHAGYLAAKGVSNAKGDPRSTGRQAPLPGKGTRDDAPATSLSVTVDTISRHVMDFCWTEKGGYDYEEHWDPVNGLQISATVDGEAGDFAPWKFERP